MANPASGLLNREKKEKEKVWQRTPAPPPRAARSDGQDPNKADRVQAAQKKLDDCMKKAANQNNQDFVYGSFTNKSQP